MATPTTTPPTLQEASEAIAAKIRLMLVQRSRGELKRTANDFISGLLAALHINLGLTDQDSAITWAWDQADDKEVAASAWLDERADTWRRLDGQAISWERAEDLGLHVDLTREI